MATSRQILAIPPIQFWCKKYMIEFILNIVSIIGIFLITRDIYEDMQEKKFITLVGLAILVVGAFLYVITN